MDTFHNVELDGCSSRINFPQLRRLLDIWSHYHRIPELFTLFGLLFVVIGLGITIGPPIWQIMRYQNTEYMITDQRIITQTGAIGLDTRFVDFDKIQEVFVQVGFIDKMFGTGTIYAITASGPLVYIGRSRGTIPMRPSLAALKNPNDSTVT
jgi:uncharacterized membrane protein YdbT with pleckstrin-like domain